MKVLHVSAGNLFGGVETLLATLARQRGLCPAMAAEFAVCFEGRLAFELRAALAPVHVLGPVQVSQPWTVWRARRALRTLLRRQPFDVLVCHSSWPQAIFGPVVRFVGLPLVFWLHDAVDGRHWTERWARLTPPDLALCNSRYTASNLPNIYAGLPTEVVYCPVALPEQCYSPEERWQTRAELHTPHNAVVVIQVSRLEAWKGHTQHVKALGMLRGLPHWVCWQVGGPQRPQEAQYLEELRRLAGFLGIAERMRFLGQRQDVRRLLAAADIHCQPNSSPEPFGIAFVEAMLAELPVVTVPLGGAREIVDESCAVLVPPDDAPALSAALGRLIQDPSLRARLGASGRARALQLCEPARQLNWLYSRLLGLARRKAAG